MFGAIFVGLSGLNAYQRGLQQVSNNVSNLNTTGFKGANVSFRNYVGADARGVSLTDPGSKDGQGVGLGDVTVNFKQGELRQSDRDLDLAIDGAGFLVLLNGTERLYARTGSFELDKDGYLVLTGTDYRLATLDSAGRPVSLSVDSKRTSAPKATTRIRFADNLSSSAASYTVSNLTVYDTAGTAHVWQAVFTRDTATPGSWTVAVSDDKGKAIGSQTLKFSNGNVDPTTRTLDFTDSSTGLTVTLDFSQGVTSFSAGDVSTLRSAAIDGYGLGAITGVTVNAKGRIELAYSNQQKDELGAVTIADFRDPQALEARSGALYADAGLAGGELMTMDDPRAGRVLAKRLEASNVDLSQQFGDLILIQRGFQASSQIVSVANDMIQQLFGIRGQG
ncbi:MAG: flagellar hook-basal body complex protein [Sphingomonas sp.]|nr:flagellar hook-basal body complex protein [Sphingomonas sp.]